MHPDLKHFYKACIDLKRDDIAEFKYAMARKFILDTHPNCEEVVDEFSELALRIFSGEDDITLATRMSEIEKTLDSCRLPF